VTFTIKALGKKNLAVKVSLGRSRFAGYLRGVSQASHGWARGHDLAKKSRYGHEVIAPSGSNLGNIKIFHLRSQ
jgi:hypothetical protein